MAAPQRLDRAWAIQSLPLPPSTGFACPFCLRVSSSPLHPLEPPFVTYIGFELDVVCSTCSAVCETCRTRFVLPGIRLDMDCYLNATALFAPPKVDCSGKTLRTTCLECRADALPCERCAPDEVWSDEVGCEECGDTAPCRGCRLALLERQPWVQWKPALHTIVLPDAGSGWRTEQWCTSCHSSLTCIALHCTHAREPCHGLCRECEQSTLASYCRFCRRFVSPLDPGAGAVAPSSVRRQRAVDNLTRQFQKNLKEIQRHLDTRTISYRTDLWKTFVPHSSNLAIPEAYRMAWPPLELPMPPLEPIPPSETVPLFSFSSPLAEPLLTHAPTVSCSASTHATPRPANLPVAPGNTERTGTTVSVSIRENSTTIPAGTRVSSVLQNNTPIPAGTGSSLLQTNTKAPAPRGEPTPAAPLFLTATKNGILTACYRCSFVCATCHTVVDHPPDFTTCCFCRRSYCNPCSFYYFPMANSIAAWFKHMDRPPRISVETLNGRVKQCFLCSPEASQFDKRVWERWIADTRLQPRLPVPVLDTFFRFMQVQSSDVRMVLPVSEKLSRPHCASSMEPRLGPPPPSSAFLAQRDVGRQELYDRLDENDPDFVPPDVESETEGEEEEDKAALP